MHIFYHVWLLTLLIPSTVAWFSVDWPFADFHWGGPPSWVPNSNISSLCDLTFPYCGLSYENRTAIIPVRSDINASTPDRAPPDIFPVYAGFHVSLWSHGVAEYTFRYALEPIGPGDEPWKEFYPKIKVLGGGSICISTANEPELTLKNWGPPTAEPRENVDAWISIEGKMDDGHVFGCSLVTFSFDAPAVDAESIGCSNQTEYPYVYADDADPIPDYCPDWGWAPVETVEMACTCTVSTSNGTSKTISTTSSPITETASRVTSTSSGLISSIPSTNSATSTSSDASSASSATATSTSAAIGREELFSLGMLAAVMATQLLVLGF